MDSGIIGAVIGTIMGVLGGAIGTYASVRNAQSDSERRYVIWWALAFWIGIGLFLGGMFIVSEPYRWLLWLPYSILLPLAINACNRGQAKFRVDQREGDGGCSGEST